MEATSASANAKSGLGSLKEVVKGAIEWRKYIFGRWVVFLVVGLVGAGLGLVYSLITKAKYKATLSFVLEDTKSGGLGAYAGLASQFGIDLGSSGSGSGVFSGDNIQAFLKSRLMVEHTLLSDTIWNGHPATLGDIYCEISGWRGRWKEKPELKDFSFPVHSTHENMSRLQDSVMTLFYNAIVDKDLIADKTDKKSSFIEVSTTTPDEVFSQLFTERLVNEAIEFYVQTKTQRSKGTVDKLQLEADSILSALNKKTFAAAMQQDINLNPSRKLATVYTEFDNRDKTVLGTMYAEVVKNLELAKMTLAEEMPIIQIIDRPVLPLKKLRVGKTLGLTVGFFLGIVLCFVYLVISKVYKDAMLLDG